jgi:hypothetical protein
MKCWDFSVIAILMLFSINLSAQKPVKVCGEYTCRAPENISLAEAKKTVLEQAKLAALAEEFGTNVAQWNSTIVKNANGTSDISFLSLGGSEVKGEWLEDIKVDYGKPYYDAELNLILSVSVCGKARAITSAGIDFSANLLNNTEAKHPTDIFHHGEDIYLSFRSPVDGYLAVYLVDDDQTAFCLLPYRNDPTGKVRIKAGKDYIFFSEKHAAPTEKSIVTEYTLTCEKSTEQNLVYIIFSPNEFIKANDVQAASSPQERTGGEVLPRELPFEDFQKWLAKNKQRDKDMKVEMKGVTIKK